jgi:beta-phosphoglucomutase family hydrolase
VTPPLPPLAPGLALVFDLDGVIVDSNPLHRIAWEAFNRRYGLETTEEMHAFMYGKRNDDIVRQFYGELGPGEIEARGAAKEALYREMAKARLQEMLVPGVREFLGWYRNAPLAVASNAEPANIRLMLEDTGLGPCFRAVVDGSQVANPKPHPDIYLKVADILGVPPANCIVFEDSLTGVQAGIAACMRVVGIRTTHDILPGTIVTVDNFRDGTLHRWLASERAVTSWR